MQSSHTHTSSKTNSSVRKSRLSSHATLNDKSNVQVRTTSEIDRLIVEPKPHSTSRNPRSEAKAVQSLSKRYAHQDHCAAELDSVLLGPDDLSHTPSLADELTSAREGLEDAYNEQARKMEEMKTARNEILVLLEQYKSNQYSIKEHKDKIAVHEQNNHHLQQQLNAAYDKTLEYSKVCGQVDSMNPKLDSVLDKLSPPAKRQKKARRS